MGFWDVVGKVVGAVLEEAERSQKDRNHKINARMKEAERSIEKAERSSQMKNPAYAKKVSQAKQKVAEAKVNVATGRTSSFSSDKLQVDANGEVLYGGKTLNRWDREWQYLGTLSQLNDLSAYNQSIGLYKAVLNGKVTYIGRAIEFANGGFRKRLRDYVRPSNSARTHGSGQTMYENADKVQISILVVGHSASDVETVKALEVAMILRHKPNWNVMYN